jgi:hypothetical protein
MARPLLLNRQLERPWQFSLNPKQRITKQDPGGYSGKSAGHIGNRSQVWRVEIRNEDDELVCESRLTLSVVEVDDL